MVSIHFIYDILSIIIIIEIELRHIEIKNIEEKNF